MPQQGPRTRSTSRPGGGSNVVRIGISWRWGAADMVSSIPRTSFFPVRVGRKRANPRPFRTTTDHGSSGAPRQREPMKTKSKIWLLAVAALVVILVVLVGIKALQIKTMIAAGKNFAPPPEAVTT